MGSHSALHRYHWKGRIANSEATIPMMPDCEVVLKQLTGSLGYVCWVLDHIDKRKS